jgi:hypothetical protein
MPNMLKTRVTEAGATGAANPTIPNPSLAVQPSAIQIHVDVNLEMPFWL